MRPSRALCLDSYVASATLEGLFQLKRKSDKIFTVFTVSAAQNSTETVNSVLKLAAPHCSVTAQSIWLALPCFTGQSQQGKEASSKFLRLCCCGAGCLVNYSCLCQCCRSLPIQCCLMAIRWTFVKVLIDLYSKKHHQSRSWLDLLKIVMLWWMEEESLAIFQLYEIRGGQKLVG